MPRTNRSTGAILAALVLLATGGAATPAHAAPMSPSFRGEPIEALASYEGQSTCSPTAKPGASALRSLVLASYDGTGDYGIGRDCAIGGTSEHKEGRAWDWKVDAYDADQDAAAKDLFGWLLDNDDEDNSFALARRLGVMYMIYNSHIWSAYNASAGWRPYTGSNPHSDHVHLSLSWPGAQQQTSYWGSYAGPRATPSATPRATPSAGTGPASTEAVAARWEALGGQRGPLGSPVGAEYTVRGGRAQDFQGGRILWSPGTGANGVWGSIGQRYTALGGPDSSLGLPTSSEVAVKGGRGNTFQGGRILWSLDTGTQVVRGSIGQRYTALGGPDGPLGLPTTDELDVAGGKANTFQGGRILWSLGTGANGVWGPIGERYTELGGPDSSLGLPTTDDVAVKGGRAGTFQGGKLYWSPATGTRAVTGPVLAHYQAYDGATGPLGLPVGELEEVTDLDQASGPAQQQLFAGGRVYLRAGQARHVRGAIRDRYLALGGPSGSLGLPVSDEYDVPGGRRSDFDGGQLTWTEATGAVTGP